MSETSSNLDIAILPLADGRFLMLPLNALAEVQQLAANDGVADFQLEWRGHELPIESLDALCGLQAPARERLTTVAVMRSSAEEGAPFRAWAFCGTASHGRVSAENMEAVEATLSPSFLGVTRWHEQDYLVPDLAALFAA